jgi:hypothetical protein
MAKFILRNRKTGELIPVILTLEQERLLAFLEENHLDVCGFDTTEIEGDFEEV